MCLAIMACASAGLDIAVPGCEEVRNQASQHPPYDAFRAPSGTKLSRHTCWSVQTGTKLSRQACPPARTGTKLALHRKKRPFWAVLGQLGENYHAFCAGTRSRATCVTPPAAVSLTERFIFIATTCLGHGKLALALTRRSCPPCRMAIGML